MEFDRRIFMVVAAVVIAILVVIAVLWMYVIPRTELTVTTAYREGSLNAINVNVKLENTGTEDIRDIRWEIEVRNGTQSFIDESGNISKISPGGSKQISTHFFGDQWETYDIHVNLSFESKGTVFTEEFTHSNGGYMNERLTDTVSKTHL